MGNQTIVLKPNNIVRLLGKANTHWILNLHVLALQYELQFSVFWVLKYFNQSYLVWW